MSISIFDLFSIGVGPSSSHTIGPMRAACRFVHELVQLDLLESSSRVTCALYNSLALTGIGHCTDRAVMLGLEGILPENVDPKVVDQQIAAIKQTHRLHLAKQKEIEFNPERDIIFHKDKSLPFHPNAMRLTSFDEREKILYEKVFYSVGGGFILSHEESKTGTLSETSVAVSFPYTTAEELLAHGERAQLSIAELVLANEYAFRNEAQIKEEIHKRWNIMKECVERGCQTSGILPGGLNVHRRAPTLFADLKQRSGPLDLMEKVSMWALAASEENAASGKMITAPTNGSAGVIPAVLHYYMEFTENPSEKGIETFFLVAGAIGLLYKHGASISGAEMGCMGEIGVACSMAAGGLVAALGGNNKEIANAAEIGMEHHLGMTCDPIMGLVQIPCIERNAMGAIKAINAAMLARVGKGEHRVSLDQVIKTMKQTGHDMQSIYKETSLGGLAANVPEC